MINKPSLTGQLSSLKQINNVSSKPFTKGLTTFGFNFRPNSAIQAQAASLTA